MPADLVTRVVEVELSPTPPLAREWIGGLGHSEGEIFVAVDLGTGLGAGAATCVILESPRPRRHSWALRVNRSIGFVDVTPCERPQALPAEWPTWIRGARIEGERDTVIAMLDVGAMTLDYER